MTSKLKISYTTLLVSINILTHNSKRQWLDHIAPHQEATLEACTTVLSPYWCKASLHLIGTDEQVQNLQALSDPCK